MDPGLGGFSDSAPRRLPRPMARSGCGGNGSLDLAIARWRTRRASAGRRGQAYLRQPMEEVAWLRRLAGSRHSEVAVEMEATEGGVDP